MDPITRARAEELLRRIERHSTAGANKRQASRSGALADGATLGTIRGLSKALPRPDQELALALWQTGRRGARLMAALLADAPNMPQALLTSWVEDIQTQDVCDLCAAELFPKAKHPLKLAERWIKQERELTRRAGFMLLCSLAAPRAKTPVTELQKMLPLIKNGAADERPGVYKAVNKALRTLGANSPTLTKKALACADEICYLFENSHTALWVAKNAKLALAPEETKRRS